MKRALSLCAAAALCACATSEITPLAEGDGLEIEASGLRERLTVEAPALQPAPAPQPAPAAQPVRRRATPPLQALAEANTAARQRPTPDGFNQARGVFTYRPGALYELYANPNYVSTILLEPGETLIDIAAGDTSRWMVSQASSETESEARTIILVRPQSAGLRTNIVLITDRRTYLVEALAQAGAAYAAQVAWSYPVNQAEAVRSSERLNFAYRIRTVRGRAPAWAPRRVFDDGRRTWIEFAASVVASDMPPLFVVTGEGAELVNYRVDANRYVVDRIFDRAELRLGVRAPTIVRIDRSGGRS